MSVSYQPVSKGRCGAFVLKHSPEGYSCPAQFEGPQAWERAVEEAKRLREQEQRECAA